jgi:hypothetical protein
MRQILKGACVAGLGLMVSACGGSGDNPAGLTCQSLSGLVEAAEPAIQCAIGCTVDNAGAAADGNFGRAAVLNFQPLAAGTVGVKVVARGNGQFAAGTKVGAIFEASSATQAGVSYQISTSLAGVAVESFSLGSDGVGSPARGTSHGSATTTLPYDAVQFQFVRASGSTAATATVYELCAD